MGVSGISPAHAETNAANFTFSVDRVSSTAKGSLDGRVAVTAYGKAMKVPKKAIKANREVTSLSPGLGWVRLQQGKHFDNGFKDCDAKGPCYVDWIAGANEWFHCTKSGCKRAKCKNPSHTHNSQPPADLKQEMVVETTLKSKIRVYVNVQASGGGSAWVTCLSTNGHASSSSTVSAAAVSKTVVVVNVKAKSWAKAATKATASKKVAKVKNDLTASFSVVAESAVKAAGEAKCSAQSEPEPTPTLSTPPPTVCPPGQIVDEHGNCAKSGDPAIQPTPSASASGGNPSPTPGPGDYKEAACYYDDTQQPVPPSEYWLNTVTNRYECPIGSFGYIIY